MDEYSAYKLLVDGSDVTEINVNRKIKKVKRLTEDEKVKNLRSLHKIKCNSVDAIIPNPVSSFDELVSLFNMPVEFLKCFSGLRYASPTPVQMQCIPVMVENHNIFTIAPTGSGKTAAFLIPLINMVMTCKSSESLFDTENTTCYPKAVILSPTVELAKQIYQEAICLINELDTQLKPKVSFYLKGKNLNEYIDIVICTPQKLKYALLKKKKEIRLNRLNWLVIDESDKMLEDSMNSFSKQFKLIFKMSKKSRDCRLAMFSATQTPEVINWLKENILTDLIYVRIGVKNAAVETVTQELRYCYSENLKFTEIKTLICSGKIQVPCLLFLDMADDASILYKFIKEYGLKADINVGLISGKLSDFARREVISDFREGKIHFLICTNLLARGIDFKGVATVINYDLPKLKEEYIHRIGRCGRAGHTGRAISFWTDDDIKNGLPAVLSIMKASNQPVNEELIELIKSKKSRNRGDKIMANLKRKYDGTIKKMSNNDTRIKMYVEKCAVRKRFLKNKINSMSTE